MINNKPYIGLVDADLLNGGTRHPNLALLKIAGFLSDNNISFRLILDNEEDIEKYTFIYISKVFSFTPNPLFFEKSIGTERENKFKLGGTGKYAILPNIQDFKEARNIDMQQLEHDSFLNRYPNKRGGQKTMGIDMRRQMPYYDLYKEYIDIKTKAGKRLSYFNDYLYYSIGFLTRGCIRHCPFCVNKLESSIQKYSELDWFLDNQKDEGGKLIRPYIYLWDDNFLASPKEVWKPALQSLIDTGRPFQFRQGLDERILAENVDGEEMAMMLSKCNYHGDFIFAFDNWKDRDKIIKALKIWKKYNQKKSTKFYLFCGYRQTKDNKQAFYNDVYELFQRIKILMEYGCVGYVMRHEDYHNSPLGNFYVQVARWCNQPQFYKKMSFWEFTYRNQSYWEENMLKKGVYSKLITYQEYEQLNNDGYYTNLRKCKNLQTLDAILDMFPEKKRDLLEMFNYKMSELVNPNLWNE